MKTLACLLSVLLLALPASAYAQVSRNEAASIAQGSSGARVLAVEKADRNGRAAWRVKLLTPQGEVRVVLVDANSGRSQ
jgi:uncharacterized membrane protein YkoI